MPRRTVRYDEYLSRFVLAFEYHDDVMFDVKRIEGRRWHPGVKFWSVPASLRAWQKLDALGFTMLEFGRGGTYTSWLERGCPVGMGVEGPDGLFPYQKQGVMRCLTRDKMVLADDPGLGKTWEAIEWARRKEWRKLVVAPKIVLSQWKSAIYARYEATGDFPPDISLRAPTWTSGSWNLVNYEYLPKLERVDGNFDLIVDEAHLCTNTKSARSKGVLKLSTASTRTLLLTGTPPSKPSRLWSFFLMCGEREPKEFFPYALRYCGAERNDFGWDFSGATHLDELQAETTHFVLRRTKEEVLHDLPPLLITPLQLDDKTGTVGERNAIMKADDDILDLLSRGHSLTSGDGIGAVQRLRVLTSKQKIPATVEYVQSQGETRVVVFCTFRETMSSLISALIGEERWVAEIHGDTPGNARESLMKEFGDGVVESKVLIIQSGVGGVGLDGLQVASTGIVHDLPWTKEELDQIAGRLHRQGQHDSVNLVLMQSSSVVEQRMIAGIQKGQDLQEALWEKR